MTEAEIAKLAKQNAPVFKAMKTTDIDEMRNRFVSYMKSNEGDDFYIRELEKKRNSSQHTDEEKKVLPIKIERYEGFADADTQVLGAARLKRTSTAQPLHTAPGVDINYTLPFDQKESSISQLWQYLIQLEDLLKQPNPNNMRIKSFVRFCSLNIELDVTSKFDQDGNPEEHKKLANFTNNLDGQSFLLRFVNHLDSGLQKRFFFTVFIVFKDVVVDDRSEFAREFMTRLATYLRTAKTKWIIAFLREITRNGFKSIISNRFRLGCTALVLSAARHNMNALHDLLNRAPSDEVITNEKMLHNTLVKFVSSMEKDRDCLLPVEYDTVFMGVILRSVLSVISQNSKLFQFLCQT